MINREMIEKKRKRLLQLIDAVYDGEVEEIHRLLEENIVEDLGLLDTEIPKGFPGKPIKSILEYALQVSQSESAKILIDFGAKIDGNIRSIILERFPALINHKKRPI
ncbi:hypothetical protein A2V71_02375 [Candidatus Berkelbacteria bacterium RBG_13_40_8]|uniref:Uncharacterized protein n=1 Tax=Candidatus Berkelbacteria bacterium RBG_13_40_8 TaxID=1797467 RepID=A0A1F5DNA6_9BACT|nr:MAG: hypothetical protein A2V71_02375 [Candidatus Berkelbacteria bacterium RBG_13_40_8]